jgi:hypothetical protein
MVNPDDGLFMKVLDDLNGVLYQGGPNVEFHVIGPHDAVVLPVGTLTWLVLSWPPHGPAVWWKCVEHLAADTGDVGSSVIQNSGRNGFCNFSSK